MQVLPVLFFIVATILCDFFIHCLIDMHPGSIFDKSLKRWFLLLGIARASFFALAICAAIRLVIKTLFGII